MMKGLKTAGYSVTVPPPQKTPTLEQFEKDFAQRAVEIVEEFNQSDDLRERDMRLAVEVVLKKAETSYEGNGYGSSTYERRSELKIILVREGRRPEDLCVYTMQKVDWQPELSGGFSLGNPEGIKKFRGHIAHDISALVEKREEVLKKAATALTAEFPGLTPQQIIEGPLAIHMLGRPKNGGKSYILSANTLIPLHL